MADPCTNTGLLRPAWEVVVDLSCHATSWRVKELETSGVWACRKTGRCTAQNSPGNGPICTTHMSGSQAKKPPCDPHQWRAPTLSECPVAVASTLPLFQSHTHTVFLASRPTDANRYQGSRRDRVTLKVPMTNRGGGGGACAIRCLCRLQKQSFTTAIPPPCQAEGHHLQSEFAAGPLRRKTPHSWQARDTVMKLSAERQRRCCTSVGLIVGCIFRDLAQQQCSCFNISDNSPVSFITWGWNTTN